VLQEREQDQCVFMRRISAPVRPMDGRGDFNRESVFSSLSRRRFGEHSDSICDIQTVDFAHVDHLTEKLSNDSPSPDESEKANGTSLSGGISLKPE
jgi:hypothetical protein